MQEVPPFAETLSFSRFDVKPKVEPFAMTQVRVLGGTAGTCSAWRVTGWFAIFC